MGNTSRKHPETNRSSGKEIKKNTRAKKGEGSGRRRFHPSACPERSLISRGQSAGASPGQWVSAIGHRLSQRRHRGEGGEGDSFVHPTPPTTSEGNADVEETITGGIDRPPKSKEQRSSASREGGRTLPTLPPSSFVLSPRCPPGGAGFAGSAFALQQYRKRLHMEASSAVARRRQMRSHLGKKKSAL